MARLCWGGGDNDDKDRGSLDTGEQGAIRQGFVLKALPHVGTQIDKESGGHVVKAGSVTCPIGTFKLWMSRMPLNPDRARKLRGLPFLGKNGQ